MTSFELVIMLASVFVSYSYWKSLLILSRYLEPRGYWCLRNFISLIIVRNSYRPWYCIKGVLISCLFIYDCIDHSESSSIAKLTFKPQHNCHLCCVFWHSCLTGWMLIPSFKALSPFFFFYIYINPFFSPTKGPAYNFGHLMI